MFIFSGKISDGTGKKNIIKFNNGDKKLVAFIFFVIVIQHMEGRKERTTKPQNERKKRKENFKEENRKIAAGCIIHTMPI